MVISYETFSILGVCPADTLLVANNLLYFLYKSPIDRFVDEFDILQEVLWAGCREDSRCHTRIAARILHGELLDWVTLRLAIFRCFYTFLYQWLWCQSGTPRSVRSPIENGDAFVTPTLFSSKKSRKSANLSSLRQ